MNKKLSIACLILIITTLLFGCSGTPKKEETDSALAKAVALDEARDGNKFAVDTKETVVIWKGSGAMGSHTGFVSVSKGTLMIREGRLTGGTVEVDMKTITGDDHRSDNNLIQHLMDADFFDVKKYPISTIAITNATIKSNGEMNITGNLAIKGITHPVSFPARVELKDGTVKANARMVIDRTDWDVRYRSGKFFDNLADQTISDSIEFNIKLVARQ